MSIILTPPEAENFRDLIEQVPEKPDHETAKNISESTKNSKANRKARKIYAKKAHEITIWWLAFVGLTLWFSAIHIFDISDGVLMALLGTTTLNILGYFASVLVYLFNPEKST